MSKKYVGNVTMAFHRAALAKSPAERVAGRAAALNNAATHISITS